MKLSKLSLADYNQLDNIPVINQDLSATDFTPVVNTYYKHTGTTTASYTNGVIYYCNSTGYAALDGSAPGLATVAKTGSYNDLLDKPTIPAAANNGTLTIQKNGTTVQTFTANQSSSVTANITVPTKTSELTNDSGFLTSHQDISGKANLSGGNTFSGNQVITDYLDIRGTAAEKHLKTRGIGGSDGNGNSSDLYLQYSSDYKTYFGKTAQSSLNADGSISITSGTTTGNLTVGGNLTVSGTTTTVDSTTLQVKDKLIEVAHGNTTTLTTPAGLVAPKYDGTNSGALVFDSTGTAYVGDVTLKDGNIDVANSGLQPLATRTGLVGGNLVQYDSSAQTLKDSGKKISDLATTSQVNAKYTKPTNGIPKTDLESAVQTSLGKADNALSLDGGTIKKSKTIKMDASANSDGANLKWGTVNSKNPYIGYASDQTDGTFVVGSLLGTNYASGLAIAGGSGNLLWKGTKVATISDIPTNYVKYTAQTLTDAQKSQARSNIGAGTSNFSGNYNDLSNKPTNYVTTDTDWQEITSKKKFLTDQLIIANEIDISASAPAPAANQYRYIDFLDKNDKRIGIVGSSIDTRKHYGAYLQAGNVATIGVLSTPDGFGYSYGPIPPNKDNTNKLATTGWVLGNTSFIPFYSDNLSTGTYRSTNLPPGHSLIYIEDRNRKLNGYFYKNSEAITFQELYFITSYYTDSSGKTTLVIYKLKINGTQVEKTYKNLFVSANGTVEVGTEYVENGTFYYKVLN